MQRLYLLLFLFFNLYAGTSQSPVYNIVIKGGHVIDPKNNINGKMDVAIADGKIASVSKDIDAKYAKQVVNATGLYVMPGIIDMHTHNFFGTEPNMYLRNSYYALPPDGYTFRTGVTTVVDAGSSGWKSFARFKDQTIDRAQTRVLAFLNIVGEGMRGGKYEQDTTDMQVQQAVEVATNNKAYVVGFKVAHYNSPDWTPVDRAVQAGGLSGDIPVMIDFGGGGLSLEELTMKRLRPGDIYTHMYGGGGRSREAIIDSATQKLQPYVLDARKRGIIWDVGYGGASFFYPIAIPATKAGFYPDVISTDQHGGSMNTSMKDILNVMSKFIALGMPLPNVIRSVTWKPAQVIKREKLGNLSVGSEGDVTILNIRDGKFGFYDQRGNRMSGNKKIECEVTIKGGKIYYDLNGLAEPLTKYVSGVPSQ